jgi:hypothetical protein
VKASGPPPSVVAFVKAVITGSLAAAAPFFLITLPLGIGTLFEGDASFEWWSGLLVILSPLIISLPIVLAASALIGLSLTLVLVSLGRESGRTYMVFGFLFGSIPFLIAMVSEDNLALGMLAFAGATGGGITGWVWGHHRDEMAAERSPD